ncbi:MAG: GNAT family N-acetyltransferase [Geminicoccaceae bacterium]|nr:GNAT family N-acetyltransferase [Geminicoccaceae bacterium]
MTYDASGREKGLEVAFAPCPSPTALEAEWQELLARADASFFLSWPWIASWLERCPHPPLLARVTAEKRLVGAALFVEGRERAGPWRLRTARLHATGDAEMDRIAIEYNDVLAERGFEAAVRRVLLRRLVDERKVRRIVLPMVLSHWEEAARSSGLRVRRRAESLSYRVDLETLRGRGIGYLDALGSRVRGQIRRAMRLYRERGDLVLEAARDLPEARAWLLALAELHEARFRSKNTSGAFSARGFGDFHRALLARAVPLGAAEILRLKAGSRPIGYLYNFVWRGWVGYYTSGFVYEPDNRLKPGLVAHALAIERYLRRGAAIYDFMAGASRYKASLADPGPLLSTLVVEPDLFFSRLSDRLRGLRERWRTRAAGAAGAR